MTLIPVSNMNCSKQLPTKGKQKRKLKDSVDQLSGSKAKRTRARNVTEEKASTIVGEASKHSKVLKSKGTLNGPNVTDSNLHHGRNLEADYSCREPDEWSFRQDMGGN